MNSIKFFFSMFLLGLSCVTISGQDVKFGDNSSALVRDELSWAGISTIRNSYINSSSNIYKGVKSFTYLNEDWLTGAI